MAVLGGLGLLPAVEAVSARIDGLDIRGATGRRLLSVRMPDLGAGLDHAIAIRRTDLHRLLLDAVAGVASVDRRFGCAAVSAHPDGAVRLSSTAERRATSARRACGPTSLWCRWSQFGRTQHGWLRERGVVGEQLRTLDREGSGQPVVRSVGLRWDPSARRR